MTCFMPVIWYVILYIICLKFRCGISRKLTKKCFLITTPTHLKTKNYTKYLGRGNTHRITQNSILWFQTLPTKRTNRKMYAHTLPFLLLIFTTTTTTATFFSSPCNENDRRAPCACKVRWAEGWQLIREVGGVILINDKGGGLFHI